MFLRAPALSNCRIISIAIVGGATGLMGCATTQPPARATLSEARAILDDAQRRPSVDPAAVAEARAALEYAEQELARAPGHPLNDHRARVARDGALAARASHR